MTVLPAASSGLTDSSSWLYRSSPLPQTRFSSQIVVSERATLYAGAGQGIRFNPAVIGSTVPAQCQGRCTAGYACNSVLSGRSSANELLISLIVNRTTSRFECGRKRARALYCSKIPEGRSTLWLLMSPVFVAATHLCKRNPTAADAR